MDREGVGPYTQFSYNQTFEETKKLLVSEGALAYGSASLPVKISW